PEGGLAAPGAGAGGGRGPGARGGRGRRRGGGRRLRRRLGVRVHRLHQVVEGLVRGRRWRRGGRRALRLGEQVAEALELAGRRRSGRTRRAERVQQLADLAERGVDGGDLLPGRARLLDLAAARVGAAELEADRELALLPEVRRRECVREQVDGLLGAPLGERALAEHVQAVDAARGALHRALELADRVVEQAHLTVGDAEVVVRLVIAAAERLLHAALA